MVIVDGLEAVEILNCNLGHQIDPQILWEKDGFAYCRCPECGLVWVNPQLTDDSVAKIYAAGFKSKLSARDRPQNFRAHRSVLRRIALYKQLDRLLDVGCFTGNFLLAAQEAGWAGVEGTEISTLAIDFARSKYSLEIHEGDLTTLELDGKYDVVTLSDVIEHVSDPAATLRVVHAILRPGGLLYMDTPHFFSIPYLYFGKAWSVFFPWHRHYFSVNNMRVALEDAGFRIKSIRSVGILPFSRFSAWKAYKSENAIQPTVSLKNHSLVNRYRDQLRPFWLGVKSVQELPFHILSMLGIHVGAKLIVYAEKLEGSD